MPLGAEGQGAFLCHPLPCSPLCLAVVFAAVLKTLSLSCSLIHHNVPFSSSVTLTSSAQWHLQGMWTVPVLYQHRRSHHSLITEGKALRLLLASSRAKLGQPGHDQGCAEPGESGIGEAMAGGVQGVLGSLQWAASAFLAASQLLSVWGISCGISSLLEEEGLGGVWLEGDLQPECRG